MAEQSVSVASTAQEIDGGGVGEEDGVEALLFLSGVTAVVVEGLPADGRGAGQSAPSPEIKAA